MSSGKSRKFSNTNTPPPGEGLPSVGRLDPHLIQSSCPSTLTPKTNSVHLVTYHELHTHTHAHTDTQPVCSISQTITTVGKNQGKNSGSHLAYSNCCIGVFTRRHHKELFQLPLQRLKRRPFHLVLGPAIQHDFIQCLRTARRTRHPIAMFHLMQYFGICHSYGQQHIHTFYNMHNS